MPDEKGLLVVNTYRKKHGTKNARGRVLFLRVQLDERGHVLIETRRPSIECRDPVHKVARYGEKYVNNIP
jgi:hypothetical protein